MSHTIAMRRLLAAALVGLAALALGLANVAPLAAEDAVPQSQGQLTYSFAPIVKKAAPAVVNVYVTSRVKQFRSPFEEEILRHSSAIASGRRAIASPIRWGPASSSRRTASSSPTNSDQGGGGERASIRVALADKREFDAKLLLSDKRSDLAVLRIVGDGKEFPFLEINNSDALEVGDLVLAIGNPFGVGQTVTSGIVSALASTAVSKGESQYFIQTDAAINPGNSGGALVDMHGHLVGINSMIFSRSGGSQGVGFAIPSNLVRPFIDSAISGRELKRPWFGAKLEPMTREIAESLGLERVTGALVAEVYPKGPAEAAGLKPGDVVLTVDGFEVADPRAVTYRLTTKGIGQSAALTYQRGGQSLTATLSLQSAPDLAEAPMRDLSGAHPFDGARVVALTSTMSQELGLGELSGLVIVDVQSGSIAQSLGMRPGDVIVRVNRRQPDSLDELTGLLEKPQRLWRFDIRRGGKVYHFDVPG